LFSEGCWLEFTLSEGRNRQIRRLCGRSGLEVLTLRRARIGPLCLGPLAPGDARPLTLSEVASCCASAGRKPKGPTPPREPPPPPGTLRGELDGVQAARQPGVCPGVCPGVVPLPLAPCPDLDRGVCAAARTAAEAAGGFA